MTLTWRPRDSRGHYLRDSEPTYSLDPYDWDDTCRHKPVELRPSAETFGHEPITFAGRTVCKTCRRPVDVDPADIQEGGLLPDRDVLWPCTSAIVLGLVPRTASA